MADAMSYEYLIRRANQCGKNGVAGADAEVYRCFERKQAMYRVAKSSGKPKNNSKIIDLAHEAGESCKEIAVYIHTGLEKVLKEFDHLFSEEQKAILNQCLTDLTNPTMENIESVIDSSEKVFIEVGAFPV